MNKSNTRKKKEDVVISPTAISSLKFSEMANINSISFKTSTNENSDVDDEFEKFIAVLPGRTKPKVLKKRTEEHSEKEESSSDESEEMGEGNYVLLKFMPSADKDYFDIHASKGSEISNRIKNSTVQFAVVSCSDVSYKFHNPKIFCVN